MIPVNARRRVMVDVGTVMLDPHALDAAVELAEIAGAEFAALFIEDMNLLRLGSLPFAAEIGAASGGWRTLTAGDIERMLRLQAMRLRHALAEAAASLAMEWSFKVARGVPLVRLPVSRGDVMVVPGALQRRSGGSPEQALRQAFQRSRGTGRRGAVAVLAREGTVPVDVLAQAQALASRRGTEVLLVSSSVTEADGDRQPGLSAFRVLRLPEFSPETLARALDGMQALFWPLPEEHVEEREIESVRQLLDCPVILFR